MPHHFLYHCENPFSFGHDLNNRFHLSQIFFYGFGKRFIWFAADILVWAVLKKTFKFRVLFKFIWIDFVQVSIRLAKSRWFFDCIQFARCHNIVYQFIDCVLFIDGHRNLYVGDVSHQRHQNQFKFNQWNCWIEKETIKAVKMYNWYRSLSFDCKRVKCQKCSWTVFAHFSFKLRLFF